MCVCFCFFFCFCPHPIQFKIESIWIYSMEWCVVCVVFMWLLSVDFFSIFCQCSYCWRRCDNGVHKYLFKILNHLTFIVGTWAHFSLNKLLTRNTTLSATATNSFIEPNEVTTFSLFSSYSSWVFYLLFVVIVIWCVWSVECVVCVVSNANAPCFIFTSLNKYLYCTYF